MSTAFAFGYSPPETFASLKMAVLRPPGGAGILPLAKPVRQQCGSKEPQGTLRGRSLRQQGRGRHRSRRRQTNAAARPAHCGETPFASLSPAPPIAICVIASRYLAVNGPRPLPTSGGGHALRMCAGLTGELFHRSRRRPSGGARTPGSEANMRRYRQDSPGKPSRKCSSDTIRMKSSEGPSPRLRPRNL